MGYSNGVSFLMLEAWEAPGRGGGTRQLGVENGSPMWQTDSLQLRKTGPLDCEVSLWDLVILSPIWAL